jgi:hypothetical protein
MQSATRFLMAALLVVGTLPLSFHDAWAGQQGKSDAVPAAQTTAHTGTQGHFAKAAAMDDWVNSLTAEMNKATGQAKIDAMARLLSALVQHRAMMLEEMKSMQDDLDVQHELVAKLSKAAPKKPGSGR